MKAICKCSVIYFNTSGFVMKTEENKIIDLETGYVNIDNLDYCDPINVVVEGMNKGYKVIRKNGIFYVNKKGLESIRRYYIETAEVFKKTYMNPRYFFDMDGTLAEWKTESSFEKLYEEGYFSKLKPIEKTIQFVKNSIKEGIDCYIITAFLVDSKYAKNEKMAWLKKHLPEIPEENWIFVHYGDDKSKYIKGGITEKDVLYDDHTPNCIQWKQAGGKAVKVLNGVNSLKKTWDGETFDAKADKPLK